MPHIDATPALSSPGVCTTDANQDSITTQHDITTPTKNTTPPSHTTQQLDERLQNVLLFDSYINPLDKACRDAEAIQLMDDGADPHKLFADSCRTYPLLYFACHWASAGVLQRMLPSKYLNAKDQLLYMWDSIQREPVGFTLQFEQTGNFLHMAAFNLNAPGARVLIDHGIEHSLDPCGRSALHWLSLNRFKGTARPDERDWSEMPLTASLAKQEARHMENAVATATVLIEAGFDVNEPDLFRRTAAHYACRYKTIPLFETLVENGACLSAPDLRGCTPIHYLVHGEGERGFVATYNLHRYTPALSAYLKQRLSPHEINAVDNQGKTPLIHAAESFSPERVRLLVDAGASLDLRDNKGCTALHYARGLPGGWRYACTTVDTDEMLDKARALWERLSDGMAEVLVVAGADTAIVDGEGRTAQEVFDENVRVLDAEMDEAKRRRDASWARHRAEAEEAKKRPGWEMDPGAAWY